MKMKMNQQTEAEIKLTQELIKMVPVATGLMTIVGISLLGWWASLAINLIRSFL